jgi:hypothetical protein
MDGGELGHFSATPAWNVWSPSNCCLKPAARRADAHHCGDQLGGGAQAELAAHPRIRRSLVLYAIPDCSRVVGYTETIQGQGAPQINFRIARDPGATRQSRDTTATLLAHVASLSGNPVLNAEAGFRNPVPSNIVY